MLRASTYPRAEWILLHAGFIFTGMVTTILGPILPLLASRWLLSDAKAGSLLTAQFFGSVLGGFSISVLLPRQGFRFALVAGFLLMAGGVGWLGMSQWPLRWVATFGYGIGLDLVIPAANLYISEAVPKRRAAARRRYVCSGELRRGNAAVARGRSLNPLHIIASRTVDIADKLPTYVNQFANGGQHGGARTASAGAAFR